MAKKKISELIDEIGEDAASTTEVAEIVGQILDTITNFQKEVDKEIEGTKKEAAKSLKALESTVSSAIDRLDIVQKQARTSTTKDYTAINKRISDEIERINDAIDEIRSDDSLRKWSEKSFRDMYEQVAADLARFDLSPKAIKKTLESLKGDDRIDKSAIKGLEELPDARRFNDLERNVRAQASMPITTMFVNGKRAKNLQITGATVSVQGDTAEVVVTGGGGGAVDSVNGQTGVVVLDTSDIDPTTDRNYVTDAQQTVIGNTSGTNTGDVTVSDTAEIDLALTGQALSASIVASSIDESKLDASVNASLDLADTSVQPGDPITDLNATAHRVFYSNGSGDVTELALGANGTFLKSNGAAVAPSFDTPSGSGDVVGPASSTDNNVVFFDGLTGKLIKDSGLALSGSNTGDQTSIVGITGTKAEFDTAVTDGNFLYVGDISQYTDEMAQDAVGGMVDTTLVYVDATPVLKRAPITGDVTIADGSNTSAIAAGVIVNADVNASAAIAVSKLAAITASRAVVSDGSGFVSAATTTATEIGYVNGVTSAIQTQINGKQATGNYITALTGDVTASGPGSVAATLATVNSNVGSFTNANITVNAKGLITAAANGTGGTGITWSEVTGTSQAASVSNGYITNNAGLVTVTLPTTAAVGSIVRIAGKGAGLWRLAQNASELIHFGDVVTTTGTGGYLQAANRYDSVEVICITADTEWLVLSSVGNIAWN